MENDIQFTVVIPLYNKERHILRAVDSVLNQSYRNFKLIIVNDGSTDKSKESLTPVLDRITLIDQPNQGESVARNTGIKASTSPYVALLDADDEWDTDFLMAILKMIKLKPDCHIFSTNYLKKGVSDSRIAISPDREEISEIDYFEVARKGNTPVSSSSVCISAKLFQIIGYFPEGIALYPDLYFWTKAAINARFIFHAKPLAIYHREADNRVCNSIVPSVSDTYFETLIFEAEDNGALKGKKLKHAKEFLCHYKLLNAFKAATQNSSDQARRILGDATPVTGRQKARKLFIFGITLLPATIANRLWITLRTR
jgi:glycosyltransferase involved in cell wall biosynthesis